MAEIEVCGAGGGASERAMERKGRRGEEEEGRKEICFVVEGGRGSARFLLGLHGRDVPNLNKIIFYLRGKYDICFSQVTVTHLHV
jgi:hypothetical protein